MVEVNVKVESAGTNNVHNNAFYAEEKILKSELQAMRDCDPSSARHWIDHQLLPKYVSLNKTNFCPNMLFKIKFSIHYEIIS